MYQTWIFQTVIFLFVLTIIAIPFGEYIARVFTDKRTFLSPLLMPVENFLYKIFGINPDEDMDWKTFAINLMLFNLWGMVALFLLQEAQEFLPFNPENFKAVRWDAALNTAISFVTNTNWQPYKNEVTISYLTHMLGLGLQNFLSAATGMTVAIALIIAFVRKNRLGLGNFWVYLMRSLIYILLPLAIVIAIVLVSQGCIDNLKPYVHAQTLEGTEQIIAQGPVASQVAIKLLGTSGGGFFSANSAHPYENPTPFTDYLQLLSVLIIAAAFPFAFGALTKKRSRGWAIFIAMMLLFIIGLVFAMWSEYQGNPLLADIGVAHGINMEGKEQRFGVLASTIFANANTATAGAFNAALGSLMPLTELVAIFNVAAGGVIFGGAGTGFVNMLFYMILTMFLIGLMIGRTPEIYGKKLEAYEILITIVALFLPSIVALILSVITAATNMELTSPHKLSEIVYTYLSCVGNNGSAFIVSNTLFYNLMTGIAMLCGRFVCIFSALALAGSIVQKKINPPTARFPTTNPFFIFILVSLILINGILTFFPVFVLGPILEYFSIF